MIYCMDPNCKFSTTETMREYTKVFTIVAQEDYDRVVALKFPRNYNTDKFSAGDQLYEKPLVMVCLQSRTTTTPHLIFALDIEFQRTINDASI